jgi:hypothetical protein
MQINVPIKYRERHVPESMQQGEGQAQRVVAWVLRSKTHGHGHAFSSENT